MALVVGVLHVPKQKICQLDQGGHEHTGKFTAGLHGGVQAFLLADRQQSQQPLGVCHGLTTRNRDASRLAVKGVVPKNRVQDLSDRQFPCSWDHGVGTADLGALAAYRA